MAIKYLDGRRFYRGFLAGSRNVTKEREYLNKINVFPVPDSDTGANLAATLNNILNSSDHNPSLKETIDILAQNALEMARGNSGIIFSQFLFGISQEIGNESRLSISAFSQSIHNAVSYMYNAVLNPVEGTMITVIKDWAESMLHFSRKHNDLKAVFEKSLERAKESLKSTQDKLEVLKKAGVVDAGGMGFVLFLEGVIAYLKTGVIETISVNRSFARFDHAHIEKYEGYRYCCETFLTNLEKEPRKLIDMISPLGDSVVSAGGCEKLHLHIHSNEPSRVFHILSEYADISNVKVDDMLFQQEIQENRKYEIGLITDSAADLPESYVEKYQINRIPIKLMFGNDIFLDKVTIDSETFFNKIESGSIFPRSSQPDPAQVNSSFDFVRSHYKKTIAISLSSRLSGVNGIMRKAVNADEDIAIFDSKHLSVSEGLIVARTAQAIDDGMSYEEIISSLPGWIEGSWIYTDIHSLDYLVKGGRVSPLTGKIAKVLNLKPIVTVDDEGKGTALGKSFSRKANMKKIIRLVKEKAGKGRLWNYAIVHSRCDQRAIEYAEKLTDELKQEPLYIMNIGPVVGVHNGIGALAVGLLVEKEDLNDVF